MKIAVGSGKGGTGKTFIATNLANTYANMEKDVAYLDCDVEEPDGHLFLQPDSRESQEITLKSPTKIDENRCTTCGACAEACSYNAIAVMKEKALIFPELCHNCGACSIVCPEDAVIEGEKKIGDLVHAKSKKMDIHYGLLQRGEGGMSPRIIKRVKARAGQGINILDSPPGTACSAVETILDNDLVILVADPTPFGVNDLKLSVEMCRTLNIEPVIIVNRARYRDENLRNYCQEAELEIIGEIPDDREIAEIYSRGELVTDSSPKYRKLFEEIALNIESLAGEERKVKQEVTPAFESKKKIEKSVTTRPEGSSKPQELVIISGKGGTGKTSLTAAFASLARDTVISDCDVDASDLHLILKPEIKESGYFSGGYEAEIKQEQCTKCGLCQEACRFDAIDRVTVNGEEQFRIDPFACEGCGVCGLVCDFDAVDLSDAINGEWYISETRFGPMSHARLGMAEENSGRLVSLTRNNEEIIASDNNLSRAIIDGSPGTGCPVIASLTGAEYALIVTEPTVSGVHDLERILEVTEHFNINSGIVVNKADINPEMTQKIIKQAEEHENTAFLGEIPYDDQITEAQMKQQSIIEYAPDSHAARNIRDIFEKVKVETYGKIEPNSKRE